MINTKEIASILGETLNNEVQIIVCTKDINNLDIATERVEEAKKYTLHGLTTLFGGCTVQETTGTWLNNGQLEEEKNYSLLSNFNDSLLTVNTIQEVKKFAGYLKEFLNQDAVSIKVNGKLYFI